MFVAYFIFDITFRTFERIIYYYLFIIFERSVDNHPNCITGIGNLFVERLLIVEKAKNYREKNAIRSWHS